MQKSDLTADTVIKGLREFDPSASKAQGQWALSGKRPALLGCTMEDDVMPGGVLVVGAGHKMCANVLLGGDLHSGSAPLVFHTLLCA